MDPQALFFVFIAVWAVLGIGGAMFFTRSRDAALKRRLYPVFLIGAALVFAGFVIAVTKGAGIGPVLMIPILIVIVALNLRQTKFCDACGRTVRGSSPTALPKFCLHCGAPLP